MTTDQPSDKLFTAEETHLLRRKYIEKKLIPVLQQRFEKYSQLKSASLSVAQYWNDEANDAVHFEWLFSVLETPDFESPYTEEALDAEVDNINLPGLPFHWDILHSGNEPRFPYDNNGIAIPLFAAFCREGCHQEMSLEEAYSLFAIFRKGENCLEVEYCGEMIRPWLEGIRHDEAKYHPQYTQEYLRGIRQELLND